MTEAKYNEFSGADSVREFLQRLGYLAVMPVIDRTEVMEDIMIPYRAHLPWLPVEPIKNESERRRKLEALLRNLTKQTELKFEITRQPVEVWYVTEDGHTELTNEKLSNCTEIR